MSSRAETKIEYYILDAFVQSRTKGSGNEVGIFVIKDGDDADFFIRNIIEKFSFKNFGFIVGGNTSMGFELKYVTRDDVFWVPLSIVLSAALMIKKIFLAKDETKVSLRVDDSFFTVSFLEEKVEYTASISQTCNTSIKSITKKVASAISCLETRKMDPLYKPVSGIDTHPFIILPVKSVNYLDSLEINESVFFNFFKASQPKFGYFISFFLQPDSSNTFYNLTVKCHILEKNKAAKEIFYIGRPHVNLGKYLFSSSEFKGNGANVMHIKENQSPILTYISSNSGINSIAIQAKINLLSIGNFMI